MIAEHATPIDLVLSDIEMPGDMDGIALAQRLSQRQPPMPTVLMTGYGARLKQAEQQQFDVLPKPCSSQALVQSFGRALSRRQRLEREAVGQGTA